MNPPPQGPRLSESPSRQLLLISSSRVHGSGYLDHCESAMKDLLAGITRLLFVPFALADHRSYAGRIRERLVPMGMDIDSLDQEPDPVSAVSRSGAILVGGGNTFRLLNELYRLNLLEIIRKRVGSGMPYVGWSAGANVACPSLKTTNDMPIVQPPSFAALDLVPFNINPHYLDPDPASTHMGETREQRIREFHEMNNPDVVGLREGAMLRIDGPNVALAGTAGARLFRKGEPAREFAPGSSLDFLLKPL